jgi:tripartite-type tricarboxylate transporter receptor subunit TctC
MPMKLPRRLFLHALAAEVFALQLICRAAKAQDYPTRPVKLIVPYAAGGPTDVCARLIAQKLSEYFGRQFYVENVAGAGGNIGTAQAAKAPPDGYTVLIAVNSYVINPVLYERVAYDPYDDFEPVTLAVKFSTAFFVHPSLPATSVKEFVSFARANAGKYSFASAGLGTPSHLLGEMFRIAQGLDLVHVPYNGSAPAIASVLAGHTEIGFAALSSAAPFAMEGKLRVLATMSRNRSQALPDVLTIAEAGFPDLDGDGWVGVLVPTGTPKEIAATLNREINLIISQTDTKERLAALGFEPVGTTPEEFAAQLRIEAAKWTKVIQAAKLKAQ